VEGAIPFPEILKDAQRDAPFHLTRKRLIKAGREFYVDIHKT